MQKPPHATAVCRSPPSCRSVKVCAKYGENSKYFDLTVSRAAVGGATGGAPPRGGGAEPAGWQGMGPDAHQHATWRAALQDMENTTGSWDVYGVDDPKRYPGMQVRVRPPYALGAPGLPTQCAARHASVPARAARLGTRHQRHPPPHTHTRRPSSSTVPATSWAAARPCAASSPRVRAGA